ncbi:MAG: RDD family protein [Candidatus Rokubacteria bacterium]|nr:RDD family protein [Candidatus Rokubacteria bacterium]
MNGDRPAGFWIRAVAALVDLAIYGLVQASLGKLAGVLVDIDFAGSRPFQGLLVAHTFLFASLYAILLHWLGGQTLGKLLVGARVVASDGGSLTLGAAVLRYLGYFVSCATLGLGYAMVGLRQDKRGLHDLVAGTRVVRLGRTAARAPAPPPVVTAPADSGGDAGMV